MPIKGLSEQRRLPRLGKIRLGIKVERKNERGEVTGSYPRAVDYFVLSPELQKVYGEKPRSLDIMFPAEDPGEFAGQFYKRYSHSRGLMCRGNGETCRRVTETPPGQMAGEELTQEAECGGTACPWYASGACKRVMNLQFLLPGAPGLGVWQIDTGSYHSIVTVNSALELIKSLCGRVSMIPLRLTLEPKEVRARGGRLIVHVLNIRAETSIQQSAFRCEKATDTRQ